MLKAQQAITAVSAVANVRQTCEGGRWQAPQYQAGNATGRGLFPQREGARSEARRHSADEPRQQRALKTLEALFPANAKSAGRRSIRGTSNGESSVRRDALQYYDTSAWRGARQAAMDRDAGRSGQSNSRDLLKPRCATAQDGHFHLNQAGKLDVLSKTGETAADEATIHRSKLRHCGHLPGERQPAYPIYQRVLTLDSHQRIEPAMLRNTVYDKDDWHARAADNHQPTDHGLYRYAAASDNRRWRFVPQSPGDINNVYPRNTLRHGCRAGCSGNC